MAENVVRAGVAVDGRDYQMQFKCNGKIDKLTIEIEPPKLTEASGIGSLSVQLKVQAGTGQAFGQQTGGLLLARC